MISYQCMNIRSTDSVGGAAGAGLGPSPIETLGPRGAAVMLGAWLDDLDAKRIPITPETIALITETTDQLIACRNLRYRARGVELAQRAMKYNLDRAIAADKVARLNEGSPTENVGLRTFSFQADRRG